MGLPWVCSPFARHGFAVGLLSIGLLAMGRGFGFSSWWWRLWVAFFFFFLVLNVDGGLWVSGGDGVRCVVLQWWASGSGVSRFVLVLV